MDRLMAGCLELEWGGAVGRGGGGPSCYFVSWLWCWFQVLKVHKTAHTQQNNKETKPKLEFNCILF